MIGHQTRADVGQRHRDIVTTHVAQAKNARVVDVASFDVASFGQALTDHTRARSWGRLGKTVLPDMALLFELVVKI